MCFLFFFRFFHMCIAQGSIRQPMTTERPFLFAHMFQVSKCSLRNLILHTFLMILYMLDPGQGQKSRWGQTLVSPESPYHFDHLLKVSNVFLNSDFVHIFFFHMYIAPGQGQTTLCGQNSDVNKKVCHFAHLLQVSKQYLWSLISYILLPIFIQVYSLGTGAGADNPAGS